MADLAQLNTPPPEISQTKISADSDAAPASVGEAYVEAHHDDEPPVAVGDVSPTPSPAHDAAPPPRPPLVVTTSSGSTPLTVPHPKRFSAMNINKKFLEQNSATSSIQTASNLVTVKSGSPAPRPSAQPSNSHSRLVTAKLTATSQLSATTGPGWSRPSSATPPVSTVALTSLAAPPPASSTASAPSPGTPSSSASTQLPHVAKVVQPQPRAAALVKKEPPKAVWGNVKPAAGAVATDTRIQVDFPTAAEVAQGTSTALKAKSVGGQQTTESAVVKPRRPELQEADTFRGVHLDPNAHHWDEMEEDDDNFLDGVIEFGDGRQYKITPADNSSDQNQDHISSDGPSDQALEIADTPVSKEERFADDFDRSWPRSRASPSMPVRDFPPHAQHSSPSSTSHSIHSPSESSRVLFNERSNRLEPYSNSHPSVQRHGFGPGPFPRRNDFSSSSVDPRGVREVPPHISANSYHVLQKPGSGSGHRDSAEPRSRAFGSGGSSLFSKERSQDRDGLPPLSVHIPSGPAISWGTEINGLPVTSPMSSVDRRGSVSESRGRRLSNMGPPPLPGSLSDRSKDNIRQLPPHLSHMPPTQRRMSSTNETSSRPGSVQSGESPLLLGPLATNATLQSPGLSPTSVISEVPAQPPPGPAVDIHEIRKTAMHVSAERARQRRQQEEEEREREKERARKKAAELEEKLKAVEAEKADAATATKAADEKSVPTSKEFEVIQIIEDAIQSTKTTVEPALQKESGSQPSLDRRLSSSRSTLGRAPSVKSIQRPPPEQSYPASIRRPSHSGADASNDLLPLSMQVESWRKRTGHAASGASRQPGSLPTPPPPPPPPLFDSSESFAVYASDDLEVVDFSDLANFVGVSTVAEDDDEQKLRPPRPVASDFFDDEGKKSDAVPASWRWQFSQDASQDHSADNSSLHEDCATVNKLASDIFASNGSGEIAQTAPSDTISVSSTKDTAASGDSHTAHHFSQTIVVPSSLHQRNPRTATFYREAPMSALDDAMSRIKGALDVMQATDSAKEAAQHLVEHHEAETSFSNSVPSDTPVSIPAPAEPVSKEQKWRPPALRPRTSEFQEQELEVFNVTRPEPPRSPRPVWNSFTIKLPGISRPVEPLPKKQYHLIKTPLRLFGLEILSFNPPVEGMHRRDFSINDVLFRKSPMYKGKFKYHVSIPRTRPVHTFSNNGGSAGPRVNLPFGTSSQLGTGHFGRSKVDDLVSWRKQTPVLESLLEEALALELNTMSRSPPPELPSDPLPVTVRQKQETLGKPDGILLRSRPEPKMPAGSAVAFYRNPLSDAAPTVNFIVSSELEQSSPQEDLESQSTTPALRSSPLRPSTLTTENVVALSINGAQHQTSTSEAKALDDSSDHVAVTPTSHSLSTPWTKSPLSFPVKESPLRGPDPEHLKAVWSQASDNSKLPVVNSLDAIGDDLTALTFTLQDVKSEDGGTPPPSGLMASSKMPPYDVTRAFQQVPPSTQRSAPLSPPSTTNPIGRPSTFSYAPVAPSSGMRPYTAYPSPMIAHSPSPTLMYPHAPSPGPRMPVNGHSPMYGQPVWMPLPAPPQNHGAMMRPSPYPTQLMAYPPPLNGTSSMYPAQPPPPNMQNGAQINGSAQQRPRMSVMSPVVSHAAPSVPMYGGSPALITAPPMMQVPPPQTYMGPVPPNRPMRSDSIPQSPMQHPPATQISHSGGYTPVPPTTSFVRQAW